MATNAEETLLTAVKQLIDLVAIGMTRGMRQVEAIELLGRSSLSNAEIAEILGTSPDSVRAERNRLKRQKPPAKPVKRSSTNATISA